MTAAQKILIAALAVAAYSERARLAGMLGFTDDLPRGIRNNNPGNIERTGTRWQGMSADQSGDDRFIVFDDPLFGIRAIGKILLTYRSKGFNTIRKIVNRWAPPNENDTDAYIWVLSRDTGIHPDAYFDLDQHGAELVAELIEHENATNPYPMSTIRAGLALAGIGRANI